MEYFQLCGFFKMTSGSKTMDSVNSGSFGRIEHFLN